MHLRTLLHQRCVHLLYTSGVLHALRCKEQAKRTGAKGDWAPVKRWGIGTTCGARIPGWDHLRCIGTSYAFPHHLAVPFSCGVRPQRRSTAKDGTMWCGTGGVCAKKRYGRMGLKSCRKINEPEKHDKIVQ